MNGSDSDDVVPVDDQHAQDLRGCFYFFFRATGCFLWLYITMFFAIIAAAVISLLFFR